MALFSLWIFLGLIGLVGLPTGMVLNNRAGSLALTLQAAESEARG